MNGTSYSLLNGACYGKLPNRDGRIAPHLNVGWHDDINTQIKPIDTADNIRKIFKGNDVVMFEKLKGVTRNLRLVKEITQAYGFVPYIASSGVQKGWQRPFVEKP